LLPLLLLLPGLALLALLLLLRCRALALTALLLLGLTRRGRRDREGRGAAGCARRGPALEVAPPELVADDAVVGREQQRRAIREEVLGVRGRGARAQVQREGGALGRAVAAEELSAVNPIVRLEVDVPGGGRQMQGVRPGCGGGIDV